MMQHRNSETADWLVRINNKDLFLFNDEIEILKEAITMDKSAIWFEDLYISIPHIGFMERIYKSDSLQLNLGKRLSAITTEEITYKDINKTQEIREQIKEQLKHF